MRPQGSQEFPWKVRVSLAVTSWHHVQGGLQGGRERNTLPPTSSCGRRNALLLATSKKCSHHIPLTTIPIGPAGAQEPPRAIGWVHAALL